MFLSSLQHIKKKRRRALQCRHVLLQSRKSMVNQFPQNGKELLDLMYPFKFTVDFYLGKSGLPSAGYI